MLAHAPRVRANYPGRSTLRRRSAVQARRTAHLHDLVDVTQGNFREAHQRMSEAFAECDFIAVDCEMSGLYAPGCELACSDDPATRFAKVNTSAQAFLLTQLGLAAFSRRGDTFEVKTFNVTLFPGGSRWGLPRMFQASSSALEFLAEHRFDFNKMVQKGVRFMSVEATKEIRQRLQALPLHPIRQPVTAAEIAFCAKVEASVTQWFTASTEPSLVVATGAQPWLLSMAQSILTRMQLPSGAGTGDGITVERLPAVGHGQGTEDGAGAVSTGLLVLRATRQDMRLHARKARAARLADLEAEAGASSIMSLLHSSAKPVVAHNGLLDFVFLVNHLCGKQADWDGFRSSLRRWLPAGVFDTKLLAQELRRARPGVLQSDSLGSLHSALFDDAPGGKVKELLAAGAAEGSSQTLPSVRHAPGYTRYSGPASEAAECADPPAHTSSTPLSPPQALDAHSAAAAQASRSEANASVQDASSGSQGVEAAAQVMGAVAGAEVDRPTRSEPLKAPAASGQAHEAGYDAFLVGACFCRLLPILKGLQCAPVKEHSQPQVTPSRRTRPGTTASLPDLAAIETFKGRLAAGKKPGLQYMDVAPGSRAVWDMGSALVLLAFQPSSVRFPAVHVLRSDLHNRNPSVDRVHVEMVSGECGKWKALIVCLVGVPGEEVQALIDDVRGSQLFKNFRVLRWQEFLHWKSLQTS